MRVRYNGAGINLSHSFRAFGSSVAGATHILTVPPTATNGSTLSNVTYLPYVWGAALVPPQTTSPRRPPRVPSTH